MRNQRRAEKISLSSELESAVFRKPLRAREIEALQARCESYQSEAPRPWSTDVFAPYSQYFGILSSLKARTVLDELNRFGYLDEFDSKPIRVFDFGAGTLGASLGAVDYFRSAGKTVERVYAFDQNRAPVDWASHEFKNFFGATKMSFGKPDTLDHTIVFAVDVLNEMGMAGSAQVFEWIKNATPSTIIILLEPASKFINQRFLKFRDSLIDSISILLPCTHVLKCPALQQEEWCHEDHPYKAPSAYWNLVKKMGFRKSLLQYSLLCLSQQKSKFTVDHARMVSRPLKSKGRCEKWLCGNGKRWKQSLMNRHRNEINAPFFEASRGDVLDCRSTGLI